MASFGGATFEERGQANGAMLPLHGARVAYAVLSVPEGAPYIQSLGYDAAPLNLPIQCTGAELSALRGKVGTTATLDYAGGSLSATLQDVADASEIKRGQDYYRATLKLVVSIF